MKIPLDKLLPHELTREDHVQEIVNWIKTDGAQKRPIAVSDATKYGRPGYYIIHDGHHRTESLKRLGCKSIMANIINFDDKKFRVLSWLDNHEIDKELVIHVGLNGVKLAPKVTKHVIERDGNLFPFQDNDEIEPITPTSLEELK